MKINEDLKKKIIEDINKCNELIDNGFANVHYIKLLIAKYDIYIKDFSKDFTDYYYGENINNYINDVTLAKSKLEMVLAVDYINVNNEEKSDPIILNNSINNVNSNSIKLSFDNVIKNIQENTYLDKEEITEIIDKINEIKDIQESKIKKTEKWEKLGSAIKWIADKGVDVGIQIIPLILQSINN